MTAVTVSSTVVSANAPYNNYDWSRIHVRKNSNFKAIKAKQDELVEKVEFEVYSAHSNRAEFKKAGLHFVKLIRQARSIKALEELEQQFQELLDASYQ
ncbi:hypothetical protein K6V78_07750 [Streptococcus gallolyticus]|uniref:hypothetical protein n=1 Tax=Streptococcus hepaticus TaxID=3349163 RepID=UPI001C94C202|nr:hypothetical protein [Streptococcus gallolyticus]MBY5041204.1 hypothetical protein [Streptococcus gallolyticus]